MKRTVLGVVLATLAMFVWGMVYWGANPLPYRVWKTAMNDETAQRLMREQFPEVGTYFVPSVRADPETLERRYQAGPVGFVHVTSMGRPVHDPSIMTKGLLLDFASVLAMAGLLHMAGPALPTYARRARFAALAGLGAAILIDGGDVAWWSITWQWKLHQAAYDATAWWVAGLVLARFGDWGLQPPVSRVDGPG
jgi:hypothetical protein